MTQSCCCEGEAVAVRQDATRSKSRILRAADYRRGRWKNGAGWTSEVHREPDVDDWKWRLSIAEVETDVPFSTFPGVERQLVLLSGAGMRLRFDNGKVHELSNPFDMIGFSGDQSLVGELLDGPTRDFNLMWKRGVVDAQIWRRPLVGAMVVFADPGETWAVHMLAGQAHFAGEHALGSMETGDTALLMAGDERMRFALDGAGEALLMRIVELK